MRLSFGWQIPHLNAQHTHIVINDLGVAEQRWFRFINSPVSQSTDVRTLCHVRVLFCTDSTILVLDYNIRIYN